MDKEFITGIICALIAVLCVVGGVTYSSVNKTKAMAEMVARGANPIAVHCALDGINTTNQQACVTIAAQGVR